MDMRLIWIYRLGIGLLAALLVFVLYLLYPIWSVFFYLVWVCSVPFLIAAFISYLLRPVIEWLEERGLPKIGAIAVIYLIFVVGVGFALYKGIPVFVDQVQEFFKSAPELEEMYQSWVVKFERQTRTLPFGIHEKLTGLVQHFEGKLSRQVTTYGEKLAHFPSFLLIATLIPFVTFYMLRDDAVIRKFLGRLIPRKWSKRAGAFVADLNVSLGGYLRGQIILSFLVGLVSYLVFLVIGMKYPLPLAVILGITNVIPTFGPIIGAIPALLIALTMGKAMMFKVLIAIAVLQVLEGNILAPFIMGKSLSIHPLFIILALIVGEEVAGIAGLVFSVPLLAVIKIAVTHARSHFRRANTQE